MEIYDFVYLELCYKNIILLQKLKLILKFVFTQLPNYI